MKLTRRQFGLTLTELLVTVAVAAVLMALAVPAARRITETMRDSAGARALIGAALNNARTIAVREGTYAGVRFQRAADGKTYMVFIVYEYDASAGLANRFVVVEGRKPLLLPEGIVVKNGDITDRNRVSVIFSSAGRLVMRPVWVQAKTADDRTFNTEAKVQANQAMFVQDDSNLDSVNRFNISNINEPVDVKTLMVSPYTGELIGE